MGLELNKGGTTLPPASQVVLAVKNLPAKCTRRKRHGFYPWVRKIPGEGNVYPLQCSRLENSLDRGAWRATVYRVTKSQTRLKRLSAHGLCPGGWEWDLERLL